VIAFPLIYLAVFLTQIALGLLTPLVPLILVGDGVPKDDIGIVAAAFYFGMLLGSRLMGPIIAACGHICAFAMFCALLADSILLMHNAAHSVLFWGVLRIATGVGSIGIFTVIESWINGAASRRFRSRAFGMYTFACLSGAALGVTLMKFSPHLPVLLDFAGISMITAILPIAALTRASPALLPRLGLSIRAVFRLSPPGVLTCFTAGFASCSLYAMLSVMLKDMHLNNGQISAVIASCMLAGMAVQLPAGFLADRFGRRRVGTVALAASTTLAFLLMMTRDLTLLWVFAVLYCASFSPLYTVGTGQSVERAQPAQLVGISAVLLFVWALGACCGPLVAAYAMSLLGDWSLFLTSFVVLGAMTIISLASLRSSQGEPSPQRHPDLTEAPAEADLAAATPPSPS
jgi:MFS family permease